MKLKHLVFSITFLSFLSYKNSTDSNTSNPLNKIDSIKTESIIKINNVDSLYQEFIDNPSSIKYWLMDSTIELTGYFDGNTFRLYKEMELSNHPEIVDMMDNIFITIDLKDDNINSHSIIKNPSNGRMDWLYNRQDKKVYIEDDVMNTSNEPSISGGYSPIHFKYLIELFDKLTYSSITMNRFDDVLNYIVKDENVREGIRNNKVSISPYPLSPTEDTKGLTIRIIDKVTIQGKVYKIEYRPNQQVGDVMDLRIRNVKIISTKRVFDIDKVSVLDYQKVKSLIGKNQVDSTNINPPVN